MLQPAYSVLEQAAQREARGPEAPFRCPSSPEGPVGGRGFQGPLHLGSFPESKPYLNAGSPFCFPGNIWVGGGVSKPRQIILTTSPPYWEGEGEINLPTFMLAFTWFRTFCQIV